MTTMTVGIASLGGNRMRSGNRPGWRKFFDAVLEPQTGNVEGEIIEYLQFHRHDLPPEVWIELERRISANRNRDPETRVAIGHSLRRHR